MELMIPLILQALQIARDAEAAVAAGNPTDAQLELHTAVMQQKVNDAVVAIDAASGNTTK